MTKIGVLSALAFIIMFFEFPLPFFPDYLKIDLSDIPAILGAFALGPVAGITIELIKNLLHLFRTTSGGIGEIANFITGTSFVFVASIIYYRKKSRNTAIIGLLAGALTMALVMSFVNYVFLIPFYFHTGISTANLPVIYAAIFPFNVVKGLILSIITALVYKSLSPVLHK